MPPSLPTPRGPLSEALFAWWRDGRGLSRAMPPVADALSDEDLHLALWACYQLHYDGFDEVPDDVEWDLETLRWRRGLEHRFEADLRLEHRPDEQPRRPTAALRAIAQRPGPPLARTVAARGELHHLRELAIHRSIYQLKEADPHTWAIPRLRGPGRAGLIEIQMDEYGAGVPGEAHAELFAAALADLGLDPTFGTYVDDVPGVTLATDNLIGLFGLSRRLRGALVGHLALFEMCSVAPMGRYLVAARRVGGLPALERFHQVHVEVDEHHAEVALRGMVEPFVDAHPELAADVVFGAAALARCEARFAQHVLGRWSEGRSSLRHGGASRALPGAA